MSDGENESGAAPGCAWLFLAAIAILCCYGIGAEVKSRFDRVDQKVDKLQATIERLAGGLKQ